MKTYFPHTIIFLIGLALCFLLGCEHEVETLTEECDGISAIGGFQYIETMDSVIVINEYWPKARCLHLVCMHPTNSFATIIHIPTAYRVAVPKPPIRIIEYHMLGFNE